MTAVQFNGSNGSDLIEWAAPSAYACNGERLWMRLKKCGEVTLLVGDWLIQADDGWWHQRTNEAFESEKRARSAAGPERSDPERK